MAKPIKSQHTPSKASTQEALIEELISKKLSERSVKPHNPSMLEWLKTNIAFLINLLALLMLFFYLGSFKGVTDTKLENLGEQNTVLTHSLKDINGKLDEIRLSLQTTAKQEEVNALSTKVATLEGRVQR